MILAIGAAAFSSTAAQAAARTASPRDASMEAAAGNCAYSVVDGDDLYRIAMRFGVSPYYLANTNRLYNPNLVYRGMMMRVPCVAGYGPSGYSNYGSSGYGSYGSQRYSNNYPSTGYGGYGTQGYSNNYSSKGYSGNYQAQGYSPNYPSTSYKICSVHMVYFGEWLKSISARFGVSWQAIAAANRLYNPNLIYAGQRLLIPCAGASSYPTYSAPSSGYSNSPYSAPSSGYPKSPSVYPTTPPSTAGAVTATMMNLMFSPATITIHVGQSVAWHNMDSTQHSATQGTCSGNTCTPAPGGFDTGILGAGQTSMAIMFHSAGTFHFYCRVHGAMMQGDVVVMP